MVITMLSCTDDFGKRAENMELIRLRIRKTRESNNAAPRHLYRLVIFHYGWDI